MLFSNKLLPFLVVILAIVVASVVALRPGHHHHHDHNHDHDHAHGHHHHGHHGHSHFKEGDEPVFFDEEQLDPRRTSFKQLQEMIKQTNIPCPKCATKADLIQHLRMTALKPPKKFAHIPPVMASAAASVADASAPVGGIAAPVPDHVQSHHHDEKAGRRREHHAAGPIVEGIVAPNVQVPHLATVASAMKVGLAAKLDVSDDNQAAAADMKVDADPSSKDEL